MERITALRQNYLDPLGPGLVKEMQKALLSLPIPRPSPKALPPTEIPKVNLKKRALLYAVLSTFANVPTTLATQAANGIKAEVTKRQEQWEQPKTKIKTGNFLIGVTAFFAIVALGGVGFSAAGINHLTVGSLSISVDVAKLASIAFYSGTGALIGLQLRKTAKLKKKEAEIQHRLELTEEAIAIMESALAKARSQSDAVEGEIKRLLETARSALKDKKLPNAEQLEQIVSSLKDTSAPYAARTDAPTLPLPQEASKEWNLHDRLDFNEIIQERLVQIYKPLKPESKQEATLKKIAILAGLGFLVIFGLQLHAHFKGVLPFKAFGLNLHPSFLAMTTVLMYAASLLDLGLSSPEKAPMQVSKARLKQEKRKADRTVLEAAMEVSRKEALERQRDALRSQLIDLQLQVDLSDNFVASQQKELSAITNPVKPLVKVEEESAIVQAITKPGLTAHVTKGVVVGSVALTLLALAGLIYSFTGSHSVNILGNVTTLTPKTMAMVAFYGVAVAAVASQVLSKMKTKVQLEKEKQEDEKLREEARLAEERIQQIVPKLSVPVTYKRSSLRDIPLGQDKTSTPSLAVAAYAQELEGLKAVEGKIAERIATTNRLESTGRLLQKGVGVAATLAGLVVFAYLAVSIIDRTGAAHLFLQGNGTSLLVAAILASNAFSTFYAGVTLWQNAVIKEKEAKRQKEERDLEARLLGADIAQHRNNLILEQELYDFMVQLQHGDS